MNAIALANTKDLSRDDWLAIRRTGIGSSDIAAVAGLNPYRSALAVYVDKVEGCDDDLSDNEKVRWGNLLESVVAKEWALRTGLKIQRRNAVLRHPDIHYALANLDYRLRDPERGWGVLEVKTTGAYAKNEWADDQAPDMYVVQLQWQLLVTGDAFGYLAVLLGGQELRWTLVERDEALIQSLIEIAADFWDRVERRDPPAPDGSLSNGAAIKTLFPRSEPAKQVVLSSEAVDAARHLRSARHELKYHEDLVAKLEQEVKVAMGDAEEAYEPGDIKPCATWRTSVSSRWDTKRLAIDFPDLAREYKSTSESRRFLLKEEK